MRLSTLGLVSVIASAFAAPAFAGTPASISGSATFISPAGFTSTVSGESVLPSGYYYSTNAATLTDSVLGTSKASLTNPAVIPVLPQFSLQGFSIVTESLQVASSANPVVAPGASFSAAAATVLADAAKADFATNGSATEGRGVATGTYFSGNIDFISAIIKAGAGVNGLD